jgi:cob(I)alamin adenosyltransferase
MVTLNRIYTRTGDDGTTGLGTGQRRQKSDLRISAFGTVDETNASIGLARLSTEKEMPALDVKLLRVQNDLFDLGADLCIPPGSEAANTTPLRLAQTQVDRLEAEIDELNAGLPSLRSFVLPGGSAAAAALHVARTICRRAERLMVELSSQPDEEVGEEALKYVNRLSDLLFVAARWANARGPGDVLWRPGGNR